MEGKHKGKNAIPETPKHGEMSGQIWANHRFGVGGKEVQAIGQVFEAKMTCSIGHEI